MSKSRSKTLLTGLTIGVVYAFLVMLLVMSQHRSVSVAYIFMLPVVLGIIPVLFSTKEQLQLYKTVLVLPWAITMTFFFLSFLHGFEGMICLVIIVGPFVLIGSLAAFIFRFIKLRSQGSGTRMYVSLLLPFAVLLVENHVAPVNSIQTVETKMVIAARPEQVWGHVKNVRHIRPEEIQPHFIHLIGIPWPLDGRLDKEGVGGTRYIAWEKGIKFRETIKQWKEGQGFTYNIVVDPASIPPTTLDEHVMIGGAYFDVVEGSYQIDKLDPAHSLVTLTCTYRITTNLNAYGRLWANFILDDFNEMILEVIKHRSEGHTHPAS